MRFEQRTVELVGAAAGRHHDGGRARELRRGVVVLDLEFLDRVQSRRAPDRVAVDLVRERGAVDHVLVRALAQAVRAVVLHPGHRHEQSLDVAAVDRELIDALALEHVAERRVVQVDYRSHVRDDDLGNRLRDRQHRVDGGRLLHLDREAPLELLHARRLDLDAVGARGQGREGIEAGRVGLGVRRHARGDVRQRHVGARHDSPGLVAHGPAHGPGGRLRPRGRSQAEEEADGEEEITTRVKAHGHLLRQDLHRIYARKDLRRKLRCAVFGV